MALYLRATGRGDLVPHLGHLGLRPPRDRQCEIVRLVEKFAIEEP